jgi:hypothetical protein
MDWPHASIAAPAQPPAIAMRTPEPAMQTPPFHPDGINKGPISGYGDLQTKGAFYGRALAGNHPNTAEERYEGISLYNDVVSILSLWAEHAATAGVDGHIASVTEKELPLVDKPTHTAAEIR